MPNVLQSSALREIRHLFTDGTVTGLSDAQLLERFASDRDEAAFAMLVARHGPMVLGVCRGVLHNLQDAEDAFQATFLVLARKAPSLWVDGSLASWLYRIALRIAVQAKADASRRRRHEQRAAGAREMEDEALGRFEPDLIPMLCQEIERLPEKYRAPVVLCHLEEMTHEAAAQALRCPVGTVHGRLSRARSLLRRRLSHRGVVLSTGWVAATLSGGESFAAAVPAPLRDATLRAALNLAAGQGVAASVGSATVASLLAAGLRTMTIKAFKAATVTALMIGVATCASVVACKGLAGMLTTPDEPPRPAAVKEATPRSDAELIQGKWSVVSIDQVSHDSSEEEKAFLKTGQFTVTITADRFTFDVDKSGTTYRLDPSKRPKQMIWIDGPGRKTVAIAIYSLEGDDLKVCLGRGEPGKPPEPPLHFNVKAAPRGTFPTLFVLKRKKEEPRREDDQRPKSKTAPDKPVQPQQGGLLHSNFDEVIFERIWNGGKAEPLFVDLDTGRSMTPPFALEPVDRQRPLVLSNLAFPEKLKDWVRFQGVDAAVQTDGRTITLLGLEMEDGEFVPKSTSRSALTPAKALELINRMRLDRSRRKGLNDWLRFDHTLKEEDRGLDLPFLTREGGIGFLNLDMDTADLRGPDGIRLNYRIERGLDLRFQGAARGGAIRRTPEPAILGDFAGFLIVALHDGRMVLKLPGNLERIEIGQGRVAVKAGPTEAAELLLEASRLVTGVMDLDARHDRVEISGRGKGATLRREAGRIRVTADDRTFECERITLGMPELRIFSVHPNEPQEPRKR